MEKMSCFAYKQEIKENFQKTIKIYKYNESKHAIYNEKRE